MAKCHEAILACCSKLVRLSRMEVDDPTQETDATFAETELSCLRQGGTC